MLERRVCVVQPPLFDSNVSETGQGIDVIGVPVHELFKNLTRLLKVARRSMCIATQVFDVFNFRIQFRRPIKIDRRRRPFALTIGSAGPRLNVRRFPGIDLDRFCVFLNSAVPIANARVLTRQHEMKVGIPGIARNRVLELEH